MKDYNTIIGIIDMRQRSISYDDCRARYHCGCNAITLIMRRFKESGLDLDSLKQTDPEKIDKAKILLISPQFYCILVVAQINVLGEEDNVI